MNLNAIIDEFNDYEKYMKWNEVFQNLKFDANAINFTFKTARHPSNQKYNRYRDILPYDHSRVILQDANNTDYINANTVECKLANRKYILTQGPLLSTCEHFWQMIWEQNTRGIIMLNHIIEKGKPKCEVYYPNVDEENCELELRFGKFNISYSSEQPFEDYVLRKLEIENLDLKEVREVYHCHYTNWPDFGEPEYTESFLRFLNECDNLRVFETDDANNIGPAVIHCSAGVGRSGTLILVDSVLQLYKKYGDNMPVNVIDVLCELRSYRMGLVQTHQQLKFAYKSIIDGIQQIKQQEEGNDGDVYKASLINHATNTKRSFSATSNNNGDDDSDDEENQYREKLRMRKQRLLEYQQKNQQSEQQQQQQQERQDKENSKCFKKSSSSSKNSKKLDDSDSDENFDNNNDDDTSDSNEFLFARSDRDIGTVKVNKPRIPLLEQQQLLQQQQQQPQRLESKVTATPSTSVPVNQDNKYSNIDNSDNQNTLTKRNISSATSDKEQRISNLVKTMKEKQRLHEQNKDNSKLKLINTYKPYLVSGGIILAGFLFIKFYKTFISSN